jgi:ParB family chromosome partitioning protein
LELRKQIERLFNKDIAEKIIYIPLDRINQNPFQPRKDFKEEELIELARSIRSYGLIQPIIVRQFGDEYQIIAGERRFRACTLLGYGEIPAIVQEMDDEKAAAVSLVENLQRKELNYLEEANAYSILIDIFSMTQEELARKIGKSQSAIANKLRLLKLPESIQKMIIPDVVTERHARALLKVNNADIQAEVIKQIYEKQLTVKETEELVEKISQVNIPREGKPRNTGQNVSMIIRDARIFLNTIKETVKRAKQTGIDINMRENDYEEEYELIITVRKTRRTAASPGAR